MRSIMGRRLVTSVALTIVSAVALLTTISEVAGAPNDLCSIPPVAYDAAKSAYPQVAAALSELEKYATAAWYTDQSEEYEAIAKALVSSCPESSRLSVVVQGIPSKDCATIYSSSESAVKTPKDYEKFIKKLAAIVGDRSVLYVLEPGAVELLTSDRCGEDTEYIASLKQAVKLLAANRNAKIYLDVPRHTLESDELTKEVVEIVRSLAADAGNVNGIALNTGDYGSTTEMARLCAEFQAALGSTELRCVIDTSRNFAHLSPNERCNPVSAGLGGPPSADTGFDNVDYLMWTKPPGESDGKCDETSRSINSVQGPPAGLFFEFGFKLLWNQGYLVQKLGLASISMSPAAAAIATLGTCARSGGACGNETVGPTCCTAEREYCQPWRPVYYQCRPAATQCGIQRVGVDLYGDDLATYFGLSPEVCCETCVTTDKCKAYTFVSLGPDGRSACYLKTGGGAERAMPGAVSAVIA